MLTADRSRRSRPPIWLRPRRAVPLWPSPLVAAAGCAWTKFESVNKILVSERRLGQRRVIDRSRFSISAPSLLLRQMIKMVSSPAMVPMTCGHATSSRPCATPCAFPGRSLDDDQIIRPLDGAHESDQA